MQIDEELTTLRMMALATAVCSLAVSSLLGRGFGLIKGE